MKKALLIIGAIIAAFWLDSLDLSARFSILSFAAILWLLHKQEAMSQTIAELKYQAELTSRIIHRMAGEDE